MTDYKFVQDPLSKKWMILAPRRAKRPDSTEGTIVICPFCPGREREEKELFRFGGSPGDDKWQVRVVPNKFPFADNHEIIIHSPDHHKNIDELPLYQVEQVIEVYKQRFLYHQKHGQVFIFHNHGAEGGESLQHPHTQLLTIPFKLKIEVFRLDLRNEDRFETTYFTVFCPDVSRWPDEVWIIPKNRNLKFGSITQEEIIDFAFVLQRVIQLLDMRHGHEFPYNFYIYPGRDWYLRIVPRVKIIGGFEIGTHMYVNTQDPKETIAFIKAHFDKPRDENIKDEYKASYKKSV